MHEKIFTGSAVAIVTPMLEDGGINYESLKRLIENQIHFKTDAIVVCGTTGESATLSDKEKHDMIKFTLEQVNGRIPVIAGTGSNDTVHAVESSVDAESLGVNGLLVVTPYYNKTSQKGLIDHYSTIANAVHTPIIMYNVPGRTGCNLLPDTCFKLSDHPNIVAIKEASGDISAVIRIKSLCRDNLDVYSGNDDQTLSMLSLGAIGVISVFANICPEQSHDIVSEYFKGELTKSKEILFEYLELMNALFCDVNPIPVKEALNFMGYNCGECRMPLVRMNESKREFLKKILKKYELLK